MFRKTVLLPTPLSHLAQRQRLLPTNPLSLRLVLLPTPGPFKIPSFSNWKSADLPLDRLCRAHHHRTNIAQQLISGELFSSANHALTTLDCTFQPAFCNNDLFLKLQCANILHIRSQLYSLIDHYDSVIDESITSLLNFHTSTLLKTVPSVLSKISRNIKLTPSSIKFVDNVIHDLSVYSHASNHLIFPFSNTQTSAKLRSTVITPSKISAIRPLMLIKTKWLGCKPPPSFVNLSSYTASIKPVNPIFNKISMIRQTTSNSSLLTTSTTNISTILTSSTIPFSKPTSSTSILAPIFSDSNPYSLSESGLSERVQSTCSTAVLPPIFSDSNSNSLSESGLTVASPISLVPSNVVSSTSTPLTSLSEGLIQSVSPLMHTLCFSATVSVPRTEYTPSSSSRLVGNSTSESLTHRNSKRPPSTSPEDQTPKKVCNRTLTSSACLPSTSATLLSIPIKSSRTTILNRIRNSTTHWSLPPLNQKVILIGDSNIARLKNLPDNYQSISLSGANIDNIRAIITDPKPTAIQPDHIILSIGFNNRKQNPSSSSIPSIKALISKIKGTFPLSNIHLATINFSSQLNKKEQSNLSLLNSSFPSLKNCSIIPPVPKASFQTTNDNIHWLPCTADCILAHWINHLNF